MNQYAETLFKKCRAILCVVIAALAFFSAGSLANAATNTSAIWINNTGSGVNWSSAGNWDPSISWVAPPLNPMTQAIPGNGFGDIDFSGTTTVPLSTVDVPWTISVLFVSGGKNVTMNGADLTLRQSTGASSVLSQGAIQIGNNNNARTLNISNNIVFDDFCYKAFSTNYLHAIIQRVGNTTINFYGRVSVPKTNGGVIFRTQSPINLYGGVQANLTPDLTDTTNGLYNVEIAMLRDGGANGTLGSCNFYYTNNSWTYMSVDRGTVNIYTNNALPVGSQLLLGDTPSRQVTLALNNFDQTLNFINEDTVTPTAIRTIETGTGAGGTLTLNDNAVTNNWTGIIMSGTGRLAKNGTGKLTFYRNQTYTGGTTIGGGILQLGSGAAGGLVDSNAGITNNGTLIINSTDGFSLNGALVGTGGLQKLASSTATLSGITPYTGPTTVAGGTLTIGASGNLSPSSAITVGSGAILDISATTGLTRSSGQSLGGSGTVSGTVNALPGSTVTPGSSVGTLTLGTTTLDSVAVNVELGNDPNTIGGGANDLLVTGPLTLTNTSTIYVTPLAALNTSTPYKVIQYGALNGTVANLTASLPYPGRYAFTVQDVNPYIQLSVAATLNGNLLWQGGNPGNPTLWDVATTTNWLNGAAPDKFLANDPVAFDDTALTNRATLSGSIVSPSLTTSNNTLAYTVDGTGTLTLNTLSANGSASFKVANTGANNLGAVAANAGTLVLVNTGANTLSSYTANGGYTVVSNGAANTFTAVAITNGGLTLANAFNNNFGSIAMGGGILRFDQSVNTSLSTPIVADAGTIIKMGNNMLTLSGNNSGFLGAIQVNGGVLRAAANNSLGDGAVVVNSGTSLDLNWPVQNALNVSLADISVQGIGAGGLGSIYSSSAHQAFALKNITLMGDTTFGGGWENIGGTFVGGGYKITKIGIMDLWIESTPADPDFGDIEVQVGLMGIETAGTTLGRPGNTVTVRSNANFNIYACLTAGSKNFQMDDGSWITGGGGAANSAFGGTMNLTGKVHAGLLSATSLITFNGSLVGTGSFNMETMGTFVLAGENIHTGGIVITNGAIRVTHPLALGTNMTVIVKTNGLSGSGQVVGNNVPRLEMAAGVTIPAGVTVQLNSAGNGDNRNTFGVAVNNDSGTMEGTLIPNGDGTIPLVANGAGSVLNINGPITNLNYVGTLNLRGAGQGFISGRILIGGNVGSNPNTGGFWTISSTNNQWAATVISSTRLIVGANDALCVTAPVFMAAAGNLDLNGFNQAVAYVDSPGGAGVIGNSGATDSLLTLTGGGTTNITTMTNAIVDVINSGTAKVAVTITNTTALLFGVNTYTGPTLVKNGGTLGGTGSILSPVTVQAGGKLSPGASIGSLGIVNLTLNAGSTSYFEVTHTPLASDKITNLGSVTFGGTLIITNIGVAPLAAGDSFQLFESATYSGGFSSIQPASPGPGLAWNTNFLASAGLLSVVASAPPNVDAIATLPDRNLKLTLSGPVGANYTIRASTNVTLPLASWPVLSSGTISTSPFTFNDLTATNFAQRFYRISVP